MNTIHSVLLQRLRWSPSPKKRNLGRYLSCRGAKREEHKHEFARRGLPGREELHVAAERLALVEASRDLVGFE